MDAADATAGASPRERILAAAAQLLAHGGREAVSTRAVSAAAGVQAPTLYRLFGDKQGLLHALAAYGMTTYLASKTDAGPDSDPVQDLRAGWDLHVGFGLAHPALYALMYGEPRPGVSPPATVAAAEFLERKIGRIAEAGRLCVSELRAAQLVHAVACGTTLTLLGLPEDRRDMSLSAQACEAVLNAITTDAFPPPSPGPVSAAVALRAGLPQTTALTDRERDLLQEWLDRITDPARLAPDLAVGGGRVRAADH